MVQSLDLTKDFVVMDTTKNARVHEYHPGLYGDIAERYNGFRGCELIACHVFSEDWTSWEMHPQGDEVVILLSGHICFLLEHEAGRQQVELKDAGQYLIVPKGVWHTAQLRQQSQVVFITPGENTQHRNSENP